MEYNYRKDLIIEEDGSSSILAPFDKAKEALEYGGYRIISLEENAELRIKGGKYADISRKGNGTREAVIYVSPKEAYLTKNSPILENPKKVVDAHRMYEEYVPTKEQLEEALENSVRIFDKAILTNRFKEEEVTSFAFGNFAEDYGKWLDNEAGIKRMPIFLNDFFNEIFARQMFFESLHFKSALNGDVNFSNNAYRFSNNAYRLRGIKGNLQDLLNERNNLTEKNEFYSGYKLLQKMNKQINFYVNKENYEEAFRLQQERDKLIRDMEENRI